MKTSNDEKVIDIILEDLRRNYNCIVTKLYASDFEVPQNRRRTIIIGIRKDLNIIPQEPTPILDIENRIPVKNILLPKNEVDLKYFLSEKAILGIQNKKKKQKKMELVLELNSLILTSHLIQFQQDIGKMDMMLL